MDVLLIIWKIILVIVAITLSVLWWRTTDKDDEYVTRGGLVRTYLAFLPVYLITALGWPLLTFFQDQNDNWLVYFFPLSWLPVFHWWWWAIALIGFVLLFFKKQMGVLLVGGLMALVAVVGIDWLSLLEGRAQHEPDKLSITLETSSDAVLPITVKTNLSGVYESVGIDDKEEQNCEGLQERNYYLTWGLHSAVDDVEQVGSVDSHPQLNPNICDVWEIPRDSILPEYLDQVPGTFIVKVDVWDAARKRFVASGKKPIQIDSTGEQPAAATASAPCGADYWKMEDTGVSPNNRWVEEGVEALASAGNNEEARRAVAGPWVDAIKVDPALLAFAYEYNTGKDADPDAYVGDDGCANADAYLDARELVDFLSDPANATILADDPSANSTNTGVSNGDVVVDAEPGISGDRAGVTVILADGRKYGILARCGNMTLVHIPDDIPVGPTDNEEVAPPQSPPSSPPVAPPTTPPSSPPIDTPPTTPPRGSTPPSSTPPTSTPPTSTTPTSPTPGKIGPPRTPSATNPGDRPNGTPPPPRPPAATPAPPEPVEGEVPEVEQPYTPPPVSGVDPGTAPPDCDKNNDGIPDEGCG